MLTSTISVLSFFGVLAVFIYLVVSKLVSSREETQKLKHENTLLQETQNASKRTNEVLNDNRNVDDVTDKLREGKF